MSRFVWVTAAVFLLWAAVVWVRRREERRTEAQTHRRTEADEIDREALEQAEREVRDLGADGRGRPLEDAVGDDWGPGTPKPPFV